MYSRRNKSTDTKMIMKTNKTTTTTTTTTTTRHNIDRIQTKKEEKKRVWLFLVYYTVDEGQSDHYQPVA
jgi:hypothetical protein